ncbi:MAG: class I SAM-dependent methyltransferase [Proteobacteria bacterium]|nr:class I SAM-dependent methyltransferase [Pseudomonadota bacterium]
MAGTNTRFWDSAARKYAAQALADPAAYERTLQSTRGYLKPSDTVVEFGCGTGTTALKLAPAAARIVASDISPEMIAIGREKAAADGVSNVEFTVATPEAAPWPDASFDAAIAFNLLHLIEARQAALANIHRLLRPGGLFISKTPCLGDANPIYRVLVPVMRLVGKAPYVAFFSSGDIEREIIGAGFEVIARERHGSKPKDPRPFLVARRT